MSETKIADHRQMVVMTGNLSDFHLANLRNWPYVIFEKKDLESVGIDYNFTKQSDEGEELDAGSVTYDFKFKKEPTYSKEELTKRLSELRRWVRLIFWEDTQVNFKKKGKKWVI